MDLFVFIRTFEETLRLGFDGNNNKHWKTREEESQTSKWSQQLKNAEFNLTLFGLKFLEHQFKAMGFTFAI